MRGSGKKAKSEQASQSMPFWYLIATCVIAVAAVCGAVTGVLSLTKLEKHENVRLRAWSHVSPSADIRANIDKEGLIPEKVIIAPMKGFDKERKGRYAWLLIQNKGGTAEIISGWISYNGERLTFGPWGEGGLYIEHGEVLAVPIAVYLGALQFDETTNVFYREVLKGNKQLEIVFFPKDILEWAYAQ